MRLGPGPHLHGLTLPGGMKGEDYDYLAELVRYIFELCDTRISHICPHFFRLSHKN